MLFITKITIIMKFYSKGFCDPFTKYYEDGSSQYDDNMYRNESVQKISLSDLKKMVLECSERVIKKRMINEKAKIKQVNEGCTL